MNTSWRMLTLVFAVLMMATAGSGDERLLWKDKPLRIVIADEDYPPFHQWDDQDNPQGFDADIAVALCKAMAARCTFRKVAFGDLLQDLRGKKSDAIISAMDITAERRKIVDFSEPYLKMPSAMAVRSGVSLTVTPEGMKGRIIAVSRACPDWPSVNLDYLTRAFGRKITIKPYDQSSKCPARGYFFLEELTSTLDQELNDLENGKVDAVFEDKISLFGAINAGGLVGKIELSPVDFFDVSEGQGIVVRKGQKTLKAALNMALRSIRDDGTFRQIESKYFPFAMFPD